MVTLGDIIEYDGAKVPVEFLEPVNSMAEVSSYKNERKVLRGFVRNKAEQKIDYYDKKMAEMKQKYDMDYSAFQNKICLMAAEVDLEEWNDFVLWGSYVKAYRYWAQFC
ncbi:MAG: hypothetical protein PHW84_03905 [Methanosarcina sp.]|nr:hypothetical protein [Methanosarcina sp.]